MQEESGYQNVGGVLVTSSVSHGLFFHPIKKENRLAHYHLVVVQLTDLVKEEVSEKEKAIADFVWVSKGDVLDILSQEDMKILWRSYLGL